MTVSTNQFLQLSGTAFDGAVLAGSHALQMVVLCGMSGLQAIPVQVNSSGCLMTETM